MLSALATCQEGAKHGCLNWLETRCGVEIRPEAILAIRGRDLSFLKNPNATSQCKTRYWRVVRLMLRDSRLEEEVGRFGR